MRILTSPPPRLHLSFSPPRRGVWWTQHRHVALLRCKVTPAGYYSGGVTKIRSPWGLEACESRSLLTTVTRMTRGTLWSKRRRIRVRSTYFLLFLLLLFLFWCLLHLLRHSSPLSFYSIFITSSLITSAFLILSPPSSALISSHLLCSFLYKMLFRFFQHHVFSARVISLCFKFPFY